MENIERKFNPEMNINEDENRKFKKFLAEQVFLPEDKWDERFKNYVDEKYKDWGKELPERSSEEQRELTFKRYLKGLEFSEEDLKDKKILDLGCGEEGDFVKECLDKDITKEIYGLDLEIDPDTLKEKYRNHFFKGNFEEDFPIKDLDYVISFGAVETQWNESDKRNPKKTLLATLETIKENGEVRIYPIRNAPEGRGLKGIEFTRKKWREILNELSQEQEIEYLFKPIDIQAGGVDKKVWLEEVLILKKGLTK